jgi:hypothetical protein
MTLTEHQAPWTDIIQIYPKTQTIGLQRAKCFLRTSSPLVHNHGATKIRKTALNVRNDQPIKATWSPPHQAM